MPLFGARESEVEGAGGGVGHDERRGGEDRVLEQILGFVADARGLAVAADVEEPRYDPEELLGLAPADLKMPLDMREIIARVVDGSRFHEFKPAYGVNLITGWASLYGYEIGILANQQGVLFSAESQKAAQFIQLANRRPVPLLFIQNVTGYMVGTGLISLFGAVTQWLIMVILGLPLAVPLAVLAFFGGFIPYIGSFITTLLAFLVAVEVGTTTDVVIMAIYTAVFNIVQGNFVAPIVYGRSVSLHPAIVLLAIPAGNEVAGIIGMFLVVPFLGIVAASGV